MTHTPGPWIQCRAGKEINIHYGTLDRGELQAGQHIATVHGPGSGATREGLKANARLIAAAPEMLEALKELVAEFDARNDSFMDIRKGYFKDTGGIAYARTIIAKMEGSGA